MIRFHYTSLPRDSACAAKKDPTRGYFTGEIGPNYSSINLYHEKWCEKIQNTVLERESSHKILRINDL